MAVGPDPVGTYLRMNAAMMEVAASYARSARANDIRSLGSPNPVPAVGGPPFAVTLPHLNLLQVAQADETFSTPDGWRYDQKIRRQMGSRGFTAEQVDEAVRLGARISAINKRTGGAATRFIHPKTGQSVIIDDITKEVLQVGRPDFEFGPESGDVPGAQLRPPALPDVAPELPEVPGLSPGTTIPEIPE